MKITTQESQAEQARRLAAKTRDQRMVNEVVSGTGMSPWEAKVVVDVIREVYFATPGGAPLRHGQLLYTCVKVAAGAGVALKDCPMQRVTLSLMGEGGDQVHGAEMLRRHRIGRLCEEARDQGGLLTQEAQGTRHPHPHAGPGARTREPGSGNLTHALVRCPATQKTIHKSP